MLTVTPLRLPRRGIPDSHQVVKGVPYPESTEKMSVAAG